MRIKKIELIGFKSFADRTEIHFGEGVTCVVGPNGCGKSNVSDAIRWVFGERSAKLLRGTHMEDVIFNGTEFRKPMGVAEVSLILDNSDHRLPIEYEEVVLTRRLDRSGQSQYFLNRTACRLKDILDLILDTGMGSNSYSMIGQGRVDEVVQADPQERRFLIEEAAGISKYKVKKLEALRKLERTEQNLLRIRDIVAEVQRNIQYSEKQARRAERYKVQFETLKKLEIQKAFLDLSELASGKNTEETRREEALKKVEALETGLREIHEKQEQQRRLQEEISGEEAIQATKSFDLRSEHRASGQKRDFNRERMEECGRRQAEIQKELELLESALNQLNQEIRTKTTEREAALAENRQAAEVYQKEKANFDQEDGRLKSHREEAERVKELLFAKTTELARLRNESHRLQARLESGRQEEKRRQEARHRLESEKKVFEARRLAHQEEMTRSGYDVSEKDRITSVLGEMRVSAEAARKKIEQKSAHFQELSSRLKLLEELHETAEESEKKLLASISSGDRLRGRLVKTLREVLEVQEGYESAVEAVLGSFAQGLIAEDVKTAQGLIQEMSESHHGPCGIFVQSLAKTLELSPAPQAVSHPEVRQRILDVVKVQSDLESVFSPLFDNVYVVENFSPENLGELLSIAQEVKLVTKQGILLGPNARIFFRNGRLSPEHGSFQRSAETSRIRKSCEQIRHEIEALESGKNAAEKEVARFENEWQTQLEREQEFRISRKATESLLKGLEERLQAMEEEIRILEFESRDFSEEASGIETQIEESRQAVEQLTAEESKLLESQSHLDEEASTLQTERERQIQSLARLKALAENHESHLKMVEAGEALLKHQMEASEVRREKLRLEEKELAHRREDMTQENSALVEKLAELENEMNEAEKLLTGIRGRRAYQEEVLRQLALKVSEDDSTLKTLREALHSLELKTMDFAYREKSIIDRISQAYSVKWEELKPEDFQNAVADAPSLEEEIRTLRERVDSFGPVNLLAVDEYEEMKQRHEFLASQERDLTQARDSLLEAIRKINRTTKTFFAETFSNVQTAFQEYYQVLFSGGHAELMLIESEEDQEAGVDIMVRPPGKKIQHISLLSGGEKTMTAMALLFALFRVKPSPLCVLDEVDAALDEANVDRFLQVLKTFLVSTQFLVITHNRKTIAVGDYLYGVTMEESGVSKIVSVKVAQTKENQNPAVAAA